METATPRVLLICAHRLFGESLETILRAERDLELVGPWNLGDADLCQRISGVTPSVVVIADENLHSEAAAELTKSIIEQFPELSVIRTGLSENVFRIVSTHILPARGVDLLETIRGCIPKPSSAGGSDPSKK